MFLDGMQAGRRPTEPSSHAIAFSYNSAFTSLTMCGEVWMTRRIVKNR
jgi:hypothetical protein